MSIIDQTAAEPLSVLLGRILEGAGGPVSLSALMERTGGRGRFVLIILLCLPFTTPVPLPGVSSVIGVAIAWLVLLGAGSRPARLPGWLGRRTLSTESLKGILAVSRRLVEWLERVVHPRRSEWLTTRWSRWMHAGLMVLLAILLTLPLPIPFTNAAPAYALILLSLCLMERDGRLIFVAYAVSIAAVVYVVGMLVGGKELFQWLWSGLMELWGRAR